jgi:capsule polysaccharide export protein KpsC/LpsZ
LTPETIKYFDDMERLFGSQGWKNFVEDITLRQQQEKSDLLRAKQTVDSMTIAFGRNEVYQYILSLEDTLNEVKKQLTGQVVNE